MPLATSPYLIRTPSEVIQEDVTSQSFIQSSTTLAYACVLLRKKDYALASRVLDELNDRKGGRYHDIVQILRLQQSIETGNFSEAKLELIKRIEVQPGDSVALGMLQACIYLELKEKRPEALQPPKRESQNGLVASKEALKQAEHQNAFPEARAIGQQDEGSLESVAGVVSSQGISKTMGPELVSTLQVGMDNSDPQTLKVPLTLDQQQPQRARTAGGGMGPTDSEMVSYQPILADPKIKGFMIWDGDGSSRKAQIRDEEVDPLQTLVPALLPMSLSHQVSDLDAGVIFKVCLAFKKFTVTTFHGHHQAAALFTGPMSESLLPMVRVENVFQKRQIQISGREAEGS